ncbi:MAG: carbon-nitrogen hydrolase family protein [Chloroflexota bacterium]
MKIGLIPLKTIPGDPEANLQHLRSRLLDVPPVDLICLPECTLTGYVFDELSLSRFSEPIPGPTVDEFSHFARRHATFICFGLLELAEAKVYNSAVLLDREGKIILKHRKIQEKPPFTMGSEVQTVNTKLRRISILICGDLFLEDARIKVGDADLLIVPMARSFDGRSPDVDRWVSEERQAYLEAVAQIGLTTVIINALDQNAKEGAFGGAMVVSAAGELLAESPHGSDDLLVYDL